MKNSVKLDIFKILLIHVYMYIGLVYMEKYTTTKHNQFLMFYFCTKIYEHNIDLKY